MADVKKSAFPRVVSLNITDDTDFLQGGVNVISSLQQIVDLVNGNLAAAAVKSSYESNADTNAFTDTEQTKLASVGPVDAAAVEAAGAVMEGDFTPPVNISLAVDSGNSYFFAEDGTPYDLLYTSNGGTAFLLGDQTNTVYQYTTAAPFSMTGAVYSGFSLSVGSQDGTPVGIALSGDDATLFMLGAATRTMYEYNLPTPGVLTGGVYSGNSVSVIAEDTAPRGIDVVPDGSAIFMIGEAQRKIFQYDMPTADSLLGASYSGISSADTGATSASALRFIEDGYKVIIASESLDDLEQFSVGTPFDPTTLSYDGISLDLSANIPNLLGFWMDVPTGKITALNLGSATSFEYDLPAAQTVLFDLSGTPEPISVGAGTFLGRTAAGDAGALSPAEARTLLNVEDGATADQTGVEIKALYEAEADTNAFTDAEQTKLTGVEDSAKDDQTGVEIKALYEAEADTNAFTDAEQTKLAGLGGAAGGPLQRAFTLFEALTVGDPVALRSDGDIEGIFEETGTLTEADVSVQGNLPSVDIAYSVTQDHYLAVYPRTISQRLMGRVGTRVGGVITWGAETEIAAFQNQLISLSYNSNNDTFLVAAKDDNSAQTIVRTVTTGTGIPVVQDVMAGPAYTPTGLNLGQAAAQGATNVTVLMASDGNDIEAVAFDTTTPGVTTQGASTVIATATAAPDALHGSDLVWDGSNGCFWLFYNKAGKSTADAIPTLRRIDISGTTLTPGSEFTLPFTGGGVNSDDWNMNIEHQATDDLMVLTVMGFGLASLSREVIFGWVVDTADGVTPVLSSAQVLFDDVDPSTSRYRLGGDLMYNSTDGVWYQYGKDAVLGDTFLLPFSVNVAKDGFDVLSRISVTTPAVTALGSFNVAYPGEADVFVLGQGDDSGTFKSQVFEASSSTNAGGFVGYLQETGLATESKLVNLKGGFDENQTGLTINENYYLANDGSLTLGATSIYVGKALAATTIQLAAVVQP